MTQPTRSQRVKDVMTTNVHVAGEQTGFKELVRLIRDNQISALPVLDRAGRVVGIVSEADLLLKEERAQLEEGRRLFESSRRRQDRAKANANTAIDLMSSPALVIEPELSIAEAARVMHERGVKRLPVVDGAGRLVGIVSRSDLLKVFLRSDEEIERELEVELIRKTLWLDPEAIKVSVDAGVVSLAGHVDRKTDKRLLVRLAAQLDGVVDVVATDVAYAYDDIAAARGEAASLINSRQPLAR